MRSNKFLYIILAAILSGTFIPSQAQVKVTDGAVLTMDPNSLLELESTNKGLLIPRMAINSLILPAPLTAPVPVGMIVFSTGGTIPDGFYYWNGANWERVISTGANILKTVTKSVNSTLTKTDNIVLASNDITITLPVVTVADDGLEITVKNVGTYTDLITVVPEAGKTIDSTAASLLTRWVGRTYVASGSNWIEKNKDTRPDHQYEVSQLGSFITIAEVVAFLNDHITGPSLVKLGGGTYQIAATQTINLPFPVTFEGLSNGETTIAGAAGVSGTPLFSCQTESYFKMLKFAAFSNAAGNDAIHFTGSGIYYEVGECDFAGFNKGIVITNNNTSLIFKNNFEDCTGAAVEIAAGAASGGEMETSECDFTNCAIGINLLSGVSETISIMTCNFYNTISGTDIGILYTPATFTTFVALFITYNTWNNQGTFISEFDFTRTDGRDADAYVENNAGMEDKNPHCKINVVNNALTTTCVTAGNWYKANWVNTSSYTAKFLINNNMITYLSSNSRDIYIIISGNVLAANINRTVTIGIVTNGVTGTRAGQTTLRVVAANEAFQFSTVIYLQDVQQNDYFEMYCSTLNNNDVLTFQDINWFVNSQ